MAQLTPGGKSALNSNLVGYDLKSLSMTGFRIGPLDVSDPKRKGTYRVGLQEEGKTIENRKYVEEPVFVKKVS